MIFWPWQHIPYLVCEKLKLLGKILVPLQQTWNSAGPHLLINCVNVCSIHLHHVTLLLMVRLHHFLNHIIVYLASFDTPIAHCPRQPPSSPKGHAGTAYALFVDGVVITCWQNVMDAFRVTLAFFWSFVSHSPNFLKYLKKVNSVKKSPEEKDDRKFSSYFFKWQNVSPSKQKKGATHVTSVQRKTLKFKINVTYF